MPELSSCLVLLQLHAPTVVQTSDCTGLLQALLDTLDRFNHLAPGCHRDNNEDLAWPGIWGEFFECTSYTQISLQTLHHIHAWFSVKQDASYQQKADQEVTLIRKADLENHNKDGGMWIVVQGKVYDIQDFKSQAPCGIQRLAQYAG